MTIPPLFPSRGARTRRSIRRAAGRFRRARRGSSAVEFALILPVLLMVWAGMSEMSHAIDNWRKVTLLARTVADLTAQGDTQNPIRASLMTDILSSAANVLRPFDATNAKIVVSAMGVDITNLNLVPRVCSSTASSNTTARATGPAAGLTVPAGYRTNGVRYMLAEVSMTYTPMIGSALLKILPGLGSTITFSASIPWPARGGTVYAPNTYTEIVLPNGAACP